MADLRGPWGETGERLTELGRKLKLHYDQQHGEERQESRQELADAARRVGGAFTDAFEAIGAAARDKEVQADVRQVGQSLVEAITVTLGQATEEIRRTLAERKGEAAATARVPADPGAAPPVAPTPPVARTEVPPATEVPPTTEVPPAAPTAESGAPGEQPPGVEPWGTP